MCNRSRWQKALTLLFPTSLPTSLSCRFLSPTFCTIASSPTWPFIASGHLLDRILNQRLYALHGPLENRDPRIGFSFPTDLRCPSWGFQQLYTTSHPRVFSMRIYVYTTTRLFQAQKIYLVSATPWVLLLAWLYVHWCWLLRRLLWARLKSRRAEFPTLVSVVQPSLPLAINLVGI